MTTKTRQQSERNERRERRQGESAGKRKDRQWSDVSNEDRIEDSTRERGKHT